MKNNIYPIISRLILIVFLAIPLIFWHTFYDHFVAYLTGNVIFFVVKQQWQLVVVSIVLFLLFLIPLSYRRKARWVEYGLVGAFFVSLFVEMYGIPLTILFASKYFTPTVPVPHNVINFHFLGVGLGMDLPMLYGSIVIFVGTILILVGWYNLYRQAKASGKYVTTGLYKYSRHPQYLGFILVILGWFIGWPTLLTLVFAPILIYKYYSVCAIEEKEMIAQDQNYLQYQKTTPMFI